MPQQGNTPSNMEEMSLSHQMSCAMFVDMTITSAYTGWEEIANEYRVFFMQQ